jgi:penicillin-binding protein 1C
VTQRGEREPKYLVAALVVATASLAAGAAWSRAVEGLGPLDLSAPGTNSPIVVDREGRLLRAFTTPDGRWRLPVRTQDVDPRFLDLLRAVEDKRFETHGGVDARAALRAAGQLARHGRVVSGASTLTMQAARLLEPREERTLAAKFRQIVRAGQLEARLSKREILDVYLALAPYGGNLEGVRAASLSYFGKEPARLSLAERALLVALPQSPEARRPDRRPEAARRARDRTIDRAVALGLASRAEADRAKLEPIPTERRAPPALAAHLADAAMKARAGESRVVTTLDARVQASVETLARETARRLGPKISAAMLVVDAASGEVRAHVGSADYFDETRAGAIDMTQAARSPGSALKPFIYALAFESGVAHPETILDDRPARYGAWRPENFDLGFQGSVSARRALQLSLNLPAVELLSLVGPSQFLARLRNAGAAILMPKEAAPGLAVGLGGVGVSLSDLTRLYVALARGGDAPTLAFLADAPRTSPFRPIADPVAAWQVADVLRGASPPRNAPAGRIAYKTGTSYGYRDAVAFGFDRRLVVGVWFGRADNGATPGLIAREVAAPVLFDAFFRAQSILGLPAEDPVRPPGALIAHDASALPPPLRHVRRDAPKTVAATAVAPLRIAYPPDGARVDLGLATRSGDPDAALALKAQGGSPPFTWLVNGAPLGPPDPRRATEWRADGAGFARVSVMDASGAVDSVIVRLE